MEIHPIIIFGASGIGPAALEIFKSQDLLVYCFLDEDENLEGSEIAEIGVMGKPNDDGFLKLIGHKTDAFVAVEDKDKRRALAKMLQERRKVMPVNAVHKQAVVAESAFLGYGNFINAGAIVGAGAKVPNHCILHSGAIVEHGCQLEDFVQVGAGAVLGAQVQVGEGAFIGAGAVISSGLKIGKNAQVAPGSVVLQHVPEGATVFGVPAKEIK